LYRFLQDNEGRPECAQGDPSCLFRKGKLRGLFFLGDEHSHDQVDGVDHAENALVLMDDAKVVSESRRLATVVKAKVDSFFRALDGSPNGDPSWFVVNIANLNCASDCGFSGGSRNRDERWGPEYAALTDAVKADPANPAAQYSLKADIGQADYTTLLNQVGRSLETEVERLVVSAFMLAQAPSTTVSPVVSVVLADSTRIRVDAAAVKLTGQQVEINQSALPSPLPDNAQLEVRYLPAG
jgi:hypothetical protein